jgi:Zn-dependent M28 family amino/carboxypeptidase
MLDPAYRMSSFKPVDLPETVFHLTIKKEQEVIRARNVIGYIEGENPNEAVVIGGHYDHVGKYNGFVFNGADDNVSGTVGMLSLARAFMETGTKPARTIVFAAWTGEEQGLWGSKYFVKNIPDDLSILLNINLDMISRTTVGDSTGQYLSLLYTTGYESFEKTFRAITEEYGFALDILYESKKIPRGGSDFTPFAKEGIPVISLFTGLHRDYHMPNDEIEFMNLDKMVEIIKLTYLGLNEILGKDLTRKIP